MRVTALLPEVRALLPGAFASGYTKPTTAYTSRRALPADVRPADAAALRLEPAHWPLIAMLVLTQIAAGIFVCAAALAGADADAFSRGHAPLAGVAFAFLNVGLAVSVLHLGRPLGAWRAFLGLRTSWMSREILVFGIFAGVAALDTLCAFGGERVAWAASWKLGLPFATAALGLLGVFCSAMIYVDTRRVFWSRELTFTRFFGTALLLGTAGTAAVLGWSAVFSGAPFGEAARVSVLLAVLIGTAIFGWEFHDFRTALGDEHAANHRSALTIWQLRRPLLFARLGLLVGATLFGGLAINSTATTSAACATLCFLASLGAQFIERYFFFTAVIAPRMPGGIGR